MRRDQQWLVLPFDDVNAKLSNEQEYLTASSHPHHVRLRLLALRLFPEKWLNRLFAEGGIRLDERGVLLHVFKTVDVQKDAAYRVAIWPALHDPLGEQVQILFEDEWCLVVEKPAGMAVHPNGPSHRGTLDEWVARRQLSLGDRVAIKHIHRLDDDTAGPVLYAKNELAGIMLDEMMREKAIERHYEALVQGRMQRSQGTIDAAIGKDRHHSARRRVAPNGDRAITHFSVIEKYPQASLVHVTLETGRTHQIRVHFSHIKHPLLGDELYGGSTKWYHHQALRGSSLSFIHPFTGQKLELVCEPPLWFVMLKNKLR